MHPITRQELTRRSVLAGAVAAPAILSWRAAAAEPVSVGMVNTISDAGFFVAQAKGYFQAAGIEVTFQSFPSASNMIAPLASGDLDVGSGAVSAGGRHDPAAGRPGRILAPTARRGPRRELASAASA